ncbi:MAG TPA: histidine kinase [Actinomycetota bacterium]|nr:histidine kinase [Actinomycetota bacterium]
MDSPRRTVVDALLALALLGAQLPSVVGWPGPSRATQALPLLLVGLQTVPVVWRRSAPVLVLAVTCAAYVFHASLDHGYTSPFFAPAVIYAVAAYAEARVSIAAGALGLVAIAGATGLEVADHRSGIADVAFISTVNVVAWVVGFRIRAARERERSLARRAAELETGRAAAAREAVERERARIARELHDVVAHGVGVMVVQAAGARRVIGRDPAAATDALAAIEGTGRTALAELRRLLGILHDDEPASLEPLPGIDSIETLAERLRAAGLAVEVRHEGERRDVPAAVGLSIYRIVQEALTNTLKHARASRATVTVAYRPGSVGVVVRDDGAGAAEANGSGRGLAGMRERVALFDGTLSAGPHPAGGFAVEAHLPVAEGGE